MKEYYVKKFGLEFTRCVNCKFMYNVSLGNFDSKTEVIEMAEKLHKNKYCKKPELIIEVSELYYSKRTKRG